MGYSGQELITFTIVAVAAGWLLNGYMLGPARELLAYTLLKTGHTSLAMKFRLLSPEQKKKCRCSKKAAD